MDGCGGVVVPRWWGVVVPSWWGVGESGWQGGVVVVVVGVVEGMRKLWRELGVEKWMQEAGWKGRRWRGKRKFGKEMLEKIWVSRNDDKF